jgi:hypothetical protein
MRIITIIQKRKGALVKEKYREQGEQEPKDEGAEPREAPIVAVCDNSNYARAIAERLAQGEIAVLTGR